nr:MAG TPA: hypothetical protein [Bacteriophage sp.]DAH14187.1 MAG TPA: hypothetical protein [Caudoviricetes sp.]
MYNIMELSQQLSLHILNVLQNLPSDKDYQ